MSAADQRRFSFSLRISRQDFLAYYQGTAQSVLVTTSCGRSLRFPARRLRPFLRAAGISGDFSLTVDASNRIISLTQDRSAPTG
ncbi:MAG: DUF2835 domain-containing protein [Pelovirga sp.]